MKYYGLDLGTSRVRLLNTRGQLVVDETSCLIIENNKRLAWGEQVNDYIRQHPKTEKQVVRPIIASSIHNFDATVDIISAATRQVRSTWLRRPSLIASVSAGSSNVERQALLQALHDSGWGQVILIPRSVLGLLGAQVSLATPRSVGLIDIGAGSSEMAVVSYGNLVSLVQTGATGGDNLEQNVKSFLRKNYKLQATSEAAQAILHTTDALSARPRRQHRLGKDEHQVNLKAEDLAPVIHETFAPLVKLLRKQLASLPIQTLTDIIESGLLLSGGVGNMRFLNKYLAQELKVPVNVLPNPLIASQSGIKFVQKNIEDYQNSLLIKSIAQYLD
jgi:rod shape-determining protein MreB